MTPSEQDHQAKMKELGRFGAWVVIFFAVSYGAVYLNLTYNPSVPWFLLVLIIGGYIIIPKAKNIMSMFDDPKP